MKTQTAKMTQTQKLVCGIGVNDLNEPVRVNGKTLKFYMVWYNMIRRCYSGSLQKKYPTYRGCSVCPDWLILSTFKKWFDIHYREGMELDKDILIQGNKTYSPEVCQFVPHYINSLLTDAGAIRGDYPLGVRAMNPRSQIGRINTTYEARCSGLSRTFKTVEGARQWYSLTKTRIVKEQAAHALGAGDITGDVYQALITREW